MRFILFILYEGFQAAVSTQVLFKLDISLFIVLIVQKTGILDPSVRKMDIEKLKGLYTIYQSSGGSGGSSFSVSGSPQHIELTRIR